MADLGEQFLLGLTAFGASTLSEASSGAYADTAALVHSLFATTPTEFRAKRDTLEADVRDRVPDVQDLVTKVEKVLAKVRLLAQLARAELDHPGMDTDRSGRVALRVAATLKLVEQAVRPIADELSKDAQGAVRKSASDQLVLAWSPWTKPFEELDAEAGALLDKAAAVVGIDGASGKLAKRVKWDGAKQRLSAQLLDVGARQHAGVSFTGSTVEVFLVFTEKVVPAPTEEDKATLVEVDGTWYEVTHAVMGVQVTTKIQPGLSGDPAITSLLGSTEDPKAKTHTVITLDSEDGLHLGEHGAKTEKAVLPVGFAKAGTELREVTVALSRNPAKEITGFELSLTVVGKYGSAVAFVVVGIGAVVTFTGSAGQAALFDLPVAPRTADKIGLRIKTDAVTGGGYLERHTRADGTTEYGGILQLELLGAGVYAVGLLSPAPFSVLLVMGVRFPKAIELSFGFTLNGVGGVLGIGRTVDTGELVKGVQSGFLTQLLFPEDPVAQAPAILARVRDVFPHRPGGLVIGPILEVGWGSEARIIEAKLGLVLVVPDPKVLILGAVRVRAPSKLTPITDLKAEVLGEIDGDRFLLIASLRDSTVAGIRVSGDLGLLIQWGGRGAFALSVGGFHPRYTDVPPDLAGLERLTMDLSPTGSPVSIVVKLYLAVTAGAVMAGIRGDLRARLGPASAHVWVGLDLIFYWVPRFGFSIDLELGLSVEVWGHSFASVRFRGTLEGTRPWRIVGTGRIDVWFLPTIPLDLGPFTWGERDATEPVEQSPLAAVKLALDQDAAWHVLAPADADVLAVLATVDPLEAGGDLVAHPLGVLEVRQTRIPLETHLDRIGSARVTAHRVHLGLPTTSAGPVGAVSTVTAPFAPGQFLALEGEALLARSGFEQLPGGCRIGAATRPLSDDGEPASVRWRTWLGTDPPDPNANVLQVLDLHLATAATIGLSRTAQHLESVDNPYLTRVDAAREVQPPLTIDPPGSATVHLADDGGRILADRGVVSLGEAARLAEAITASGAAHAVAVSLGAL